MRSYPRTDTLVRPEKSSFFPPGDFQLIQVGNKILLPSSKDVSGLGIKIEAN
jgi:hypothetical protein